jgi:hypothetical protein
MSQKSSDFEVVPTEAHAMMSQISQFRTVAKLVENTATNPATATKAQATRGVWVANHGLTLSYSRK